MKKIMLLVIISLLVGMVSACSPAETIVPDESGEGGQDSSEADGDEKIVYPRFISKAGRRFRSMIWKPFFCPV